ncbi:CBS domain-containing protein, partial [Vibrio vulnificus]|uniref:CBS domain-containing protein n=1 Tax=Vibrio vulnificus TaxID=672 RepID=UPI0019D4B988
TRVRDVMVREVDVLDAATGVVEAVAAMEAGRHQAFPVVDDARHPVGLASRGQALHWTLEGGHGADRLGALVAGLPLA